MYDLLNPKGVSVPTELLALVFALMAYFPLMSVVVMAPGRVNAELCGIYTTGMSGMLVRAPYGHLDSSLGICIPAQEHICACR